MLKLAADEVKKVSFHAGMVQVCARCRGCAICSLEVPLFRWLHGACYDATYFYLRGSCIWQKRRITHTRPYTTALLAPARKCCNQTRKKSGKLAARPACNALICRR